MSEIDVSKCKYYNNGWCELPESRDDIRCKPCGDMTLFDCYYKQLQKSQNTIIDGLQIQLMLLAKNSKLNKCLNKIEKFCKVHTDFCKDNKKNCELCPHEPCEDVLILQLIKQVKGNK